ncbi:MAG: hypothetical protein H6818_08820 [Phycisphaerales bacterium]|nr:hypothetical protein [Phycisphaerales bacterium]MCB9862673.1 hypothetical protein [Phycisphaerales bacterium]
MLDYGENLFIRRIGILYANASAHELARKVEQLDAGEEFFAEGLAARAFGLFAQHIVGAEGLGEVN